MDKHVETLAKPQNSFVFAYAPYAKTVDILLSSCGKCIMTKWKSSLLSYILVERCYCLFWCQIRGKLIEKRRKKINNEYKTNNLSQGSSH
jgi:hypothetical protein